MSEAHTCKVVGYINRSSHTYLAAVVVNCAQRKEERKQTNGFRFAFYPRTRSLSA